MKKLPTGDFHLSVDYQLIAAWLSLKSSIELFNQEKHRLFYLLHVATGLSNVCLSVDK